MTPSKQRVEEDGFSVLPNVFSKPELQTLIESVSQIQRHESVRSRGGVYAIRNLLQLSPVVRAGRPDQNSFDLFIAVRPSGGTHSV